MSAGSFVLCTGGAAFCLCLADEAQLLLHALETAGDSDRVVAQSSHHPLCAIASLAVNSRIPTWFRVVAVAFACRRMVIPKPQTTLWRLCHLWEAQSAELAACWERCLVIRQGSHLRGHWSCLVSGHVFGAALGWCEATLGRDAFAADVDVQSRKKQLPALCDRIFTGTIAVVILAAPRKLLRSASAHMRLWSFGVTKTRMRLSTQLDLGIHFWPTFKLGSTGLELGNWLLCVHCEWL